MTVVCIALCANPDARGQKQAEHLIQWVVSPPVAKNNQSRLFCMQKCINNNQPGLNFKCYCCSTTKCVSYNPACPLPGSLIAVQSQRSHQQKEPMSQRRGSWGCTTTPAIKPACILLLTYKRCEQNIVQVK